MLACAYTPSLRSNELEAEILWLPVEVKPDLASDLQYPGLFFEAVVFRRARVLSQAPIVEA